MKKIVLFIFTSLIVYDGIAQVNNSSVTKNNPDPQTGKYVYVKEKHVGMYFIDHSLVCKDPGTLTCDWDNPPITPAGSVEILESEAFYQIGIGVLSGTFVKSNVSVSWTATGVDDFEINMDW